MSDSVFHDLCNQLAVAHGKVRHLHRKAQKAKDEGDQLELEYYLNELTKAFDALEDCRRSTKLLKHYLHQLESEDSKGA